MEQKTAIMIGEVTVTDPDSKQPVEVCMFKHEQSGAIFGIDASYLVECFNDDEDPIIPDPFNEEREVILKEL